jgi:hypothetical protein
MRAQYPQQPDAALRPKREPRCSEGHARSHAKWGAGERVQLGVAHSAQSEAISESSRGAITSRRASESRSPARCADASVGRRRATSARRSLCRHPDHPGRTTDRRLSQSPRLHRSTRPMQRPQAPDPHPPGRQTPPGQPQQRWLEPSGNRRSGALSGRRALSVVTWIDGAGSLPLRPHRCRVEAVDHA